MATCAPRPLSRERTSAGGRFTLASSARTKPTKREAFWVDGIVWWAQPHSFQQANHPFTFFAPEVASGMQHSDDAFACHDMRAAAAPTDTITAGAPLAVEWYLQANHPGDCALYISYDTDLDTPRRWIKLKNFVGCAGDAGMLEPGPDGPAERHQHGHRDTARLAALVRPLRDSVGMVRLAIAAVLVRRWTRP